jgi:predicted transcriptional regulator
MELHWHHFPYYNIERQIEIRRYIMRAVMLAFRADPAFAAKVDQFAQQSGVSRSDYVRRAVEEKNARALEERIAFLSKALSTDHRQAGEQLDATAGDGLADR